ncbi:hypothetical protein KKF91_22110, partial [Myxococcota bacterium]|nr:hypothetical protein [Myxococcota bacterium]
EACVEGSVRRRPCEDGGEARRACEGGVWGAWGPCEGGGACVEGEVLLSPCGDGGQRRSICVDGAFVDGPCEGEAACVEGASESRPCDGGGVMIVTCVEGVMVEGLCEGAPPCADGAQEARACEGGQQLRDCEAGAWSPWGPCICEEGATITEACGQGGLRILRCVDGVFEPEACFGEDVCAPGERQRVPCDGGGTMERVCQDGQFVDGPCEGAPSCEEGDIDARLCESVYVQHRVCEGGAWGEFDDCGPCRDDLQYSELCDDGSVALFLCFAGLPIPLSTCPEDPPPGECAEGQSQERACDDGQAQRRACEGGAWCAWSPCGGASGACLPCPQLPSEGVTRIASPLQVLDLSPPQGLEDVARWEWVVLDRPQGSTSVPMERFNDPSHPENGGAQDNPATPNARFYVDLIGAYDIGLFVTHVEGLTAPSERCDGAYIVHITTRAGDGLHFQLTWNTPDDLDQSDQEGVDLDIHLRHPQGASWSVAPHDCFYQNRNPDWGPVGEAGDPSLDIDDINGAGPENITLPSPEANIGAYHLGVEVYNAALGLGLPEVETTARMRVHLDGLVLGDWTRTLNQSRSFWEILSLEWRGDRADIEEIDVVTSPSTP